MDWRLPWQFPQLLHLHASAPAGTHFPRLLGDQASHGKQLWIKKRGQWEDPGVRKSTEITFRTGLSCLTALLPVWRSEAERKCYREPQGRDSPPGIFSWRRVFLKLPLTTSLPSTKPSWASQTLLVRHTLLSALEDSWKCLLFHGLSATRYFHFHRNMGMWSLKDRY